MFGKHGGIWKNAARSLTAAMIILALATSLMPALAPRANAQDCPVGQVLDANGICVPELVDEDGNSDTGPADEEAPDPGNQEDVTPTPTPEGGEEPPAEVDPTEADPAEADPPEEGDPANLLPVTPEPVGDGSVTVHKYDCGANPDVATKSLEELRGSCAPAAGIVFGVTNLDAGDVVLTSEEFATDASGVAAFTVPNPYTVIINEVIPGGYGDPLAFCGYPANNQDNALYQYFPAGGALYFPLAAGEQLYCDWFNAVPVDPADQGNETAVWINKYECNDSPALSVGTPLPNLDDYGCDLVDGVTFDVSDGNTNLSGVTGASGSGELVLGPFTGQVVAITETVPAGHGYGDPVVYCGSFAGEELPAYTQMGTSGASVDLAVVEGEDTACIFLNILAEANDESDAVADIIVHKYACDQDPAPSSETEIDSAFQHAGCSLMDGVDFTVEGQGTNFADTRTTGAEGPGTAQWLGLNTAQAYTIIETVPAGYDTPIPYCVRQIGPTIVFSHAGPVSSIGFLLGEEDEHIECYWANVPVDDGKGDFTIHKYQCTPTGPPVILGRDGIDAALQKAGCTTMDGVEFTLSDFQSVLDVRLTGADGPGTIHWNLTAPQSYKVTETIPPGFGAPEVYCWNTNGGVTAPYDWQSQGEPVEFELAPGDHATCYWINIPDQGDGSIHINKFTCPEGYDPYAQGIDPFVDCSVVANGIEFLLNGANAQVTGQVLDGAVSWTGLTAGAYYVDETEPAGTAAIFIWDCQGNDTPMIQGSPISSGPFLVVELMPGDHIVCNWFNVPEAPDTGTVTVIKYACSTAAFVSVDDCQIFEGGAGFDLSSFDGSKWAYVASGTTNAQGALSFTGLGAGLYQIDETTGTWCRAVADSTDQDGYLVVDAGKETTVWVYNCGVNVPKLPPTKYPNTGVGHQPASGTVQAAPVLPNDAPETDPARDKPVQISIPAIDLSAQIETLEIVEGAFQDPTTSEQVAWYKDTAKLGEDGNIVMAGHLNYWGDPEGVFYALSQVKEGDQIVVTAADGTLYRYEVIAVSQQVANSRTLRQITQPTDAPTLTLITCGGAWDPSIQSYLHRTVVRAELIGEA